MIPVFLSYSKRDHLFAELAAVKLAEANIQLWRDHGKIRAGSDWQQGIERGISGCFAVLVALSTDSSESSYVTYEWAYAIGKGKPIVPLKITKCTVHPKLATIQHLDFSVVGALPWSALIERIEEIEVEADSIPAEHEPEGAEAKNSPDEKAVKDILTYLNQRGYQLASFDRLRRRVDENLTNERINQIILKNSTIFRHANIKNGKSGIARLS